MLYVMLKVQISMNFDAQIRQHIIENILQIPVEIRIRHLLLHFGANRTARNHQHQLRGSNAVRQQKRDALVGVQIETVYDYAILLIFVVDQHAELVEQQKFIDAIIDFNEVARRTDFSSLAVLQTESKTVAQDQIVVGDFAAVVHLHVLFLPERRRC